MALPTTSILGSGLGGDRPTKDDRLRKRRYLVAGKGISLRFPKFVCDPKLAQSSLSTARASECHTLVRGARSRACIHGPAQIHSRRMRSNIFPSRFSPNRMPQGPCYVCKQLIIKHILSIASIEGTWKRFCGVVYSSESPPARAQSALTVILLGI
jgi:hypothetical protein